MSQSLKEQAFDLQTSLCMSEGGLRTLAALLQLNADHAGACGQNPSEFSNGLSALLNMAADSLRMQRQPLEDIEVAAGKLDTIIANAQANSREQSAKAIQ